ncbi:hypothetical protein MTR_4g051695 [Medicago truncatula]|uniref:Uncharacterized protein n=1 Tax=Medicago truncatula TaxID=3880 RepID=A0A072UJE1_MEDTR|nr:hypothetical protein MTR_4g051695 [Medicago truncatula]
MGRPPLGGEGYQRDGASSRFTHLDASETSEETRSEESMGIHLSGPPDVSLQSQTSERCSGRLPLSRSV